MTIKKDNDKKLVSIIIPAYKQEKTIKKDILSIYETMSQTRWNFEIIVIVDGLVDKTLERVKVLRKNKVKVFGYKTNRGKGYALRYGMARAMGDYIGFIDAGMDIDPNGISMLLEHMEWYGADVVIGSKRHPASKTNYPFIRKIYSWGYHLPVRILFGLNVKDTQSGLKVYKREVLEKVLPRLLVKQFAFDVEMLAVAKSLGFSKIYEAPIDIKWKKEKTSFTAKIIFDKNIQRMIVDTLAVFYRLKILKYYRDENRDKWLYQRELDTKPDVRGKKNIKFSIIVPVRKINAYVKESIPHILNLSYQNFEVLIITDLPEKNIFKDKRVRIIDSKKDPTPGPKRNLGARKAKGSVLVFMDDDAFPEDDWLDRAYEIFKDKKVYALGGPAVTPRDASLLERLGGRVFESWLASGGTSYRYAPGRARIIKDYPSVNLFVRKKDFNKVGGFTTEFWPGEDTKLCLDLVHLYGRGFPYDPSPIVYHHRRQLLLPHLKQVSRYGRHRGQFAKIFPETSRVPSYFVPLFFVAGLFIGPLAAVFIPQLWVVYFVVLAVYLLLLLIESVNVFITELSLKAAIYFMVGIFWTHVVYGVNFLIGLVKKPKFVPKKVDFKTGKYLEG